MSEDATTAVPEERPSDVTEDRVGLEPDEDEEDAGDSDETEEANDRDVNAN